ncbi:MAG TPA: hypothetical protein PLE74_07910 [Candidatus Cloacimonadota bacterium]|nr:hypothetical protein [Candidatus Cloacimonadota bacterium]HPT72191.1 hypothetical protein [Candidatus Cloacimonadota bacterium]
MNVKTDKDKELFKNILKADEIIIDLLANNYIEQDNKTIAWGRFIGNSQEKQIGIYGTCSALSTIPRNKRESKRGYEFIDSMFKDNVLVTKQPKDSTLIYKLIHLLFAYKSDRNKLEILLNSLMKRKLISHSWGYYYVDEQLKDEKPRIIPTALVLSIILSDKDIYIKYKNEVDLSVEWLLNSRPNVISLDLTTNALVLLVFVQYLPYLQVDSAYISTLKEQIKDITDELRSKIKIKFLKDKYNVIDIDDYQSWDPIEKKGKSNYYYFLPHLLIALSFIKLVKLTENSSMSIKITLSNNKLNFIKRYIANVLNYYTLSIITSNGLIRPNTNNEKACVDQFWCHLLFSEFENQKSVHKINFKQIRKKYFAFIPLVITLILYGIYLYYNWKLEEELPKHLVVMFIGILIIQPILNILCNVISSIFTSE